VPAGSMQAPSEAHGRRQSRHALTWGSDSGRRILPTGIGAENLIGPLPARAGQVLARWDLSEFPVQRRPGPVGFHNATGPNGVGYGVAVVALRDVPATCSWSPLS